MDMEKRKRKGKIQSKVDYILSGNDINWKRYGVIDTEFDSDHRLIVGKLWCKKHLNYRRYLKSRTTPPRNIISDLTSSPPNSIPNKLLDDLMELSKEERKNTEQKPPQDESRISKRTFTMMRAKTEARKQGRNEEAKQLRKDV